MVKKYEFWFVVGSQSLYGPDVLNTVEARAKEMAAKMSEKLPYPLVFKGVVKTTSEGTQYMKDANRADECAGVVTWCHTFSPSKMWIAGLELLQKPWCHMATQYDRRIPCDAIDMA